MTAHKIGDFVLRIPFNKTGGFDVDKALIFCTLKASTARQRSMILRVHQCISLSELFAFGSSSKEATIYALDASYEEDSLGKKENGYSSIFIFIPYGQQCDNV